MTYVSEKYQLGFIADYLTDRGIEYSTEIEMYSIPIDIAGTVSNDVITIELKSRDIGRGLKQAERNLHYADYSYLSVWEDFITEASIEKLKDSPVGLLAVDGGVKEITPAKENCPHPYPKGMLQEMIADDI